MSAISVPRGQRRRGHGPNGFRPEQRRERDITLQDRYELEEGRIFLSGIQALVRVAFDQHRRDERAGLNTATFVSGYQGSPLGGLDKEFSRQRELCERFHVKHVPGLNEELGATSVFGSQLSGNLDDARYDGVCGMWYGKAPGVDRAADAIRHANFAGVSRTGGAVALAGDDPSCKSSTLPSATESLLSALHLPVFFPGSVQEVLDYGAHALACSRASGLWTSLKIVTNVADAAGTAEVSPDRVSTLLPQLEWDGRPWEHRPDGNLLAPGSLELERSMLGVRTQAALEYARLNGVNRIERFGPSPWLGIVAAGKAYHDLRQALADMGLDERGLARAGIRLLKLGMIWPLEPQIVREFAGGLHEILVVEEKTPFVETQLKELLYGTASAPVISGKRDEQGAELLPATGDLDSDKVARAVGSRLRAHQVVIESAEARLRKLEEAGGRALPLPMAARTPFFCSGCPHNSSTPAPDGTLVGAGIGCHTMILLNPEGRGEITGITQMGGEGAQWIGMAPFTESEHFVQNIGDGTFHHSGSLAIRAAASAGVNVTYKIFYNDTVAMTGGQDILGQLSVPEMTRWLELEGVKKIVVTSDEPKHYDGLSQIASVRGREDMLAVQEELSHVEGVTVLIHDQECAAELRRARKRGKAEDPPQRVHINERVCEGCGDCGKKSACLSVLPVETEFGRKTQIHQSSCNKDYSCLEGDCPSFLTVIPKKAKAKPELVLPPALPEPRRLHDSDEFTVRMMGIGGTGVVTTSQILGMAAMIDGLHVSGLDQTGLSQKGGPVISDVRLSRRPIEGSNKVSASGVDLYLGFDALGAADHKNLAVADPARTTAVVSTHQMPTGTMVLDPSVHMPAMASQLDAVERVTLRERNVYLDAQALSETLFGDHMPANLVALGAAYQRGVLPVSGDALEQAIHLNGAGVEKNLAAFAWGRACVAAPDAVAAATEPPPLPEPVVSDEARELIDSVGADGELLRLLEVRVPDLIAYQDVSYAREYVDFVRGVPAGDVQLAVARNLYKLMAYKDEYEVARLHLDEFERARVSSEFGPDAKVYFMLHPPLLRALGMKRKLKLGSWFVPFFKALRAMRRVRGTKLDLFGLPKVRRVERALIGEYRTMMSEALAAMTPANEATVLELAELPDEIRGYEEIKLRSVKKYEMRAEKLRKKLAERAVTSGALAPPR